MTRYLFLFFMLLTLPLAAQQQSQSDSLILSGVYTGKNIYVQNPWADVANQIYCTDSVLVNGKRCFIHLNRSAYEINLDSVVHVLGADVTIIIYYKKTCRPKALISMSFPQTRSKVEFTSFGIDTTGHLHFTTRNTPTENRPPFVIEQFRGNEWRIILHIPQKWNVENTYDATLPLIAGINTFRLSEMSYSESGKVITVDSGIPALTCSIDGPMNFITCSDTAYFEIQDSYGLKLNRGYAQKIDISQLNNGSYVLIYENQRLVFDIKRSKKKK